MEQHRITSPGWLLKQDNMALINQCRKYIQMEFGIRLLFSQPDLVERIREFSSYSQNRKLLVLVRDLENRLNLTLTEPPARLYRGQPVAATATEGQHPDNFRPTPVTIYRGQRRPKT